MDMKLHVIGSSSKGNSYALEGENEILLLEAGMPFREVKKAIDWQVSKITGCLISHIHNDHAGYIGQYEKQGFPVTIEKEMGNIILHASRAYTKTEFDVKLFPLPHCATPNYGFFISHPELGKLLFMTDFEYCKYDFSDLKINHILIEANYSREILDRNNPNSDHVILGHAEIETTAEFVRKNRTSELMNVILLHLSDGNSDENMFKNRIKEVAGAGVFVDVADARKTFELSLLPF